MSLLGEMACRSCQDCNTRETAAADRVLKTSGRVGLHERHWQQLMTYEGLEGLSEFIEGDFGQVSVPWRQGGTQKNKGKGSLEMGMSLGGLAHAPATQAVCVLMSGKYSFLTLALHRFCFTKKPGIIYFPSPYKNVANFVLFTSMVCYSLSSTPTLAPRSDIANEKPSNKKFLRRQKKCELQCWRLVVEGCCSNKDVCGKTWIPIRQLGCELHCQKGMGLQLCSLGCHLE